MMAASGGGCRPSHLLRRALDLIDPPSSSSDGTLQSGGVDGGEPPSSAEAASGVGGGGGPTRREEGAEPTLASSPGPKEGSGKKKSVRFDESCKPPKGSISADDAVRAYDLLVHAAGCASSPRQQPIDMSANWEKLRVVADIYRALLVASCLLLELLPRDLSGGSECPTPEKGIMQSRDGLQTCPLAIGDDPPYIIPPLTPAVERGLLSTARRCILLLQALERTCSAKAIAQRHDGIESPSLATILPPSDGDDIHDYDRPTADLRANYDWHDDGALPRPLATHGNGDDEHGTGRASIVQQCCYRPQQPNDPPSSRYERSARTRDWVRGERIVSLRLEDYEDDGGECKDGSGADDAAPELATASIEDEMMVEANGSLGGESNHACTGEAGECDSSNGRNGIDEGEDNAISLNISPAEVAMEEDCLLDILLPNETAAQRNEKRAGIPKGGKRKKRRRRKGAGQLDDHATPADAATGMAVDQNVFAREGFLLLVNTERSYETCDYFNANATPLDGSHPRNDERNTNRAPRVYAELHPAGHLSIEDRSVRGTCNNDCNGLAQQMQPLSPRIRHWDYMIGAETQCEPCLPDGTSSFQFLLSNVRLLGASSLNRTRWDGSGSFRGGSNAPNHRNGTMAAMKSVDLMFRVDEGTGGDFIEGYEWVTALSGASSIAASLQKSMHLEFGAD